MTAGKVYFIKKVPVLKKALFPATKKLADTVKFQKLAPARISPPNRWCKKPSIALKYKVKQIQNGKFTSNYKASPIDFETQISLQR